MSRNGQIRRNFSRAPGAWKSAAESTKARAGIRIAAVTIRMVQRLSCLRKRREEIFNLGKDLPCPNVEAQIHELQKGEERLHNRVGGFGKLLRRGQNPERGLVPDSAGIAAWSVATCSDVIGDGSSLEGCVLREPRSDSRDGPGSSTNRGLLAVSRGLRGCDLPRSLRRGQKSIKVPSGHRSREISSRVRSWPGWPRSMRSTWKGLRVQLDAHHRACVAQPVAASASYVPKR